MRFSSDGSLSYIYIPLHFSISPFGTFMILLLITGVRITFLGGLKIIFGGTHWSDAHRLFKKNNFKNKPEWIFFAGSTGG